MGKINIKLKECCLDCDHFDVSGIVGFGSFIACCGEPERVIACGHMAVCKKYLESGEKIEVSKKDKNMELKPCPFCGGEARIVQDENGFGVTCLSCGVELGYKLDETESEAINDWNTRIKE